MDFYVEIKNEDHSRAVQKRLFELGFGWAGDGGQCVQYTKKRNLSVTTKFNGAKDRTLHFCRCRTDDVPVYTLEDLYSEEFISEAEDYFSETNDFLGFEVKKDKDSFKIGCSNRSTEYLCRVKDDLKRFEEYTVSEIIEALEEML